MVNLLEGNGEAGGEEPVDHQMLLDDNRGGGPFSACAHMPVVDRARGKKWQTKDVKFIFVQ